MNSDNDGAAAAAIVEGRRAAANLAELHGRLEWCFARSEPFVQAGKYMSALLSDVPRKNGWQIAEYVGDATPDRTQRLLNHAVWDHDAARGVVRRFVTAQLCAQRLRVAALDESGQEKSGSATAGAQRQYMGCAGRIANGVNTVYCTYATPGGHALVAARIYLPADQLDDPQRRAAMGVGDDVEFKTKPELAVEICRDMVADGTMPPWASRRRGVRPVRRSAHPSRRTPGGVCAAGRQSVPCRSRRRCETARRPGNQPAPGRPGVVAGGRRVRCWVVRSC